MTKKSDAPAIRFKGFSDAWEQRKLSGVIGKFFSDHSDTRCGRILLKLFSISERSISHYCL